MNLNLYSLSWIDRNSSLMNALNVEKNVMFLILTLIIIVASMNIISGLVIFVTFLDYYVQIKGVQLFGGGKKSTNGAIIGLIAGLFIFPPFGILIGPFIGALIGALMESDNNLWKSIKIATGAFVGFISGVILKISVCGYIIYYFVTNVI